MTDVMESELDSLKQRATLMGIKFHPSIGLETLRSKVNGMITGEGSSGEPTTNEEVVVDIKVETKAQRDKRKRNEAMRLRRILVTCMNPGKKDYEGDIITFSNRLVGTIGKYIHFGVPWHVEQCILDQLETKQYQTFSTTTDSRGNKTRQGRLVPEFAIQILPDLTEEELKDLAQRQQMAAGTAA